MSQTKVGCPTSWQGVTQNGHRGQNRVLYTHEQNTSLLSTNSARPAGLHVRYHGII